MTQHQQSEKERGPDFMTVLTVVAVLGLVFISVFRPQIRAAVDLVSPYLGVTVLVAGILVGVGWWSTQAKTVSEARSRSGLFVSLVGVGVVAFLSVLALAWLGGWK